MTQGQQGFIESKFGKVFLTILSVFLIFAGPTYIVYGLNILLKIDFFVSTGTGFALLVVGLVVAGYLYRNKVFS